MHNQRTLVELDPASRTAEIIGAMVDFVPVQEDTRAETLLIRSPMRSTKPMPMSNTTPRIRVHHARLSGPWSQRLNNALKTVPALSLAKAVTTFRVTAISCARRSYPSPVSLIPNLRIGSIPIAAFPIRWSIALCLPPVRKNLNW